MARMITRSMKASGHYCVRFPNGLSPKNKTRVQRKKHERANLERVEIIYRECPAHSMFVNYIHSFGAMIAYTYIVILYAHLFRFIWLKEQQRIGYEPRLMIGY
jgi:hypothetical protein